MPAILTPAVALRYLLQLSTDVRAALVLDGGGRVLAGNASLGGPARELLGVLDGAVPAGGAAELLVHLTRDGARRGSAHVVRAPAPGSMGPRGQAPAADIAPDPLALVVVAGPLALLPLLRHDLLALSRELSGAAREPSESPAIPAGEVIAWDASRRVQALDGADFAAGTAIFAGLGLLDAGRALRRSH